MNLRLLLLLRLTGCPVCARRANAADQRFQRPRGLEGTKKKNDFEKGFIKKHPHGSEMLLEKVGRRCKM